MLCVARRVLRPGLEPETGNQFGKAFLVPAPELQLFQFHRQLQIAFHREQCLGFGEPVERLSQILAHRAADLIGMPHHLFERAVLLDPLRRGLGSDFFDSRHVVHRIADERQVIEHAFGRNAELRLDARGVEALVRHRVDEGHVVADQLREVLVAGGNHATQAALLGFARERAYDVVRLHAVDLQQRPARGPYCVEERSDLRAEIVGHGRPVRLVLRVHVVAEGLASRIENAGEIVGLVVGKEAP